MCQNCQLNGALEAFWYLPCPHICKTASLFCAQCFRIYFQSSAHTLGWWSNLCEGICCSHCCRPRPLSRYHRCCRCCRCCRHHHCCCRQCHRHQALTLASTLTIAAASANVTVPPRLLSMVGCCVVCCSSPAALSAVQIYQPPPLVRLLALTMTAITAVNDCHCHCHSQQQQPPKASG